MLLFPRHTRFSGFVVATFSKFSVTSQFPENTADAEQNRLGWPQGRPIRPSRRPHRSFPLQRLGTREQLAKGDVQQPTSLLCLDIEIPVDLGKE